jgi:hypothetical protein
MPRKHKVGVVVKLHSFLTSVLDGAQQSAVRLGGREGREIEREIALCIKLEAGRFTGSFRKKSFLPLLGFEP